MSATSRRGRPCPFRARHGSAAMGLPGRRVFERREPVEWARHRLHVLGADLCVMRRGLNARVTEERLDHPNVGTVLEQMRCESVPQRMERDLLLEPNLRHGDPQYLPDGIAADRRPSTATGKQVRT